VTSNVTSLGTVADLAQAIVGRVYFIQSAGVHDDETGSYPNGGFARDFATADGERVRVEAFTREQFADLAKTTRLARTFAFLERVLDADFCARGGLTYTPTAPPSARCLHRGLPGTPSRAGCRVRRNLGAVRAPSQPHRLGPARRPGFTPMTGCQRAPRAAGGRTARLARAGTARQAARNASKAVINQPADGLCRIPGPGAHRSRNGRLMLGGPERLALLAWRQHEPPAEPARSMSRSATRNRDAAGELSMSTPDWHEEGVDGFGAPLCICARPEMHG
jgi:hypothetical protein